MQWSGRTSMFQRTMLLPS